ncbi:MAG: class I SAM-dependent methyltransferase [Chloroflexi bacterium]|nr:class I SAM-dependent methyltransferase [Chloroflexota bacterium]
MSPPEQYEEEAGYWLRELRARLAPGRRRILDLGTGGGHHLHRLTDDFDADAVDLSQAMLAHSQRLNPSVRHHVADMRTVRLGEVFDAVLIHDAIDYMTTEADLLAVFASARAHLHPGGLLLAAPDNYAETFKAPGVCCETNRDAETELTWVEYSVDLDPSDTTIETTYVFFIKRGGELRVEVDGHTTGLFPIATWERLLTETGFEVERIDYPVSKDGRPMFLWVGRLHAQLSHSF